MAVWNIDAPKVTQPKLFRRLWSNLEEERFEQMAQCEMCEAGVWAGWERCVDDRHACVSSVLQYAQGRYHVVCRSSRGAEGASDQELRACT